MNNLKYSGKRKILIVDDNEINREILASILESEYDIMKAENGLEGYNILEKEYKNLSLVLLDVYMPVMTGFEFLEKIKADELLSSVPVIVTTGSDKAEDEVKCLKLGASDFITKPYNHEVVRGRVHSIIKLKESVATLSAIEYDELTGLYTLPAFYHHAGEIIRANPDIAFDVCAADIKDSKMILNIYGAKKNDELIKYIANNYKKLLPFGILSRYGDHFYCIYAKTERFSDTKGFNYYKELVENAPISSLTIKYGIYSDVDKSLPVSEICNRALIAAKSIKNDFHQLMAFYDENFSEKMVEAQKLEARFEEALKNKEFTAYYQPKVDPNTGKIVAAEALVRWVMPGNKLVSPASFVPLFEKDGLITRLDEYIFEEVCQNHMKRMSEGKKFVPVSINLSRNSIYTKNVGEKYKKIAEKYGVPLNLVPLEITESATTQSNAVTELAEHLTMLGFSLHMDDFGTGYSSFSSLASMPFDVLKLDKSLIDKIGTKKGEILIRHSIAFAQEVGMKVVAEGVEEKNQVEFLKNSGCDMIQGFYYSKPVDVSTFVKMLDNLHESEFDIAKEYNNIKYAINVGITLDDNDLSMMMRHADELLEGFLVYKASTDESIIYVNKKLMEMFQCDSEEEFRSYTSNSFKGIVDKEDYDEVEKNIFFQVNSSSNHDDAVEYHIKRKDGSLIYVHDEGHCRYTEAYGNIFYVYIRER